MMRCTGYLKRNEHRVVNFTRDGVDKTFEFDQAVIQVANQAIVEVAYPEGTPVDRFAPEGTWVDWLCKVAPVNSRNIRVTRDEDWRPEYDAPVKPKAA